MFYVYTLKARTGRSYVGSTADYTRRLAEHNAGKCHSTRGEKWELVFAIPFSSKRAAEFVERYLKCGNTPDKRLKVLTSARKYGPVFAAAEVLTAAYNWKPQGDTEDAIYTG